jgi:hypothetical protein
LEALTADWGHADRHAQIEILRHPALALFDLAHAPKT